MKVLRISIIPLALLLFTLGCASTNQGHRHKHQTNHPHMLKNAKDAGDYHIANFMNRRASKIGVQILDRYEEPFYLGKEKIRAEITRENGDKETVWLKGEGYAPEIWEGEAYGTGATVYSKHFKWVQNEHAAQLRVWVPLPDGNTYELAFDCVAKGDLPSHSGLLN